MKISKNFIFLAVLILLGFSGGLFAGGSKEEKPPVAAAGGGDAVVSPNFSPGVKDTALFPIKAETDEANKKVLKQYKLVLADSSGKTVREWSNRDENEPGFFARLFIALGFMDKSKIEVPPSVEWDGKDSAGAFVPDGEYTYTLEIWDDAGTSAKSPPARIIVDNTPPSAEVKPAFTVFSPDGDGRKDVLPLAVKTSKETLWKAAVKDSSGKDVDVREFAGGLPEALEWNGTDGKGTRFPDGVYTLELSTTDAAGNAFSLRTEPVTIDSAPRAFGLGLDLTHFSPNGDGVKDKVTLTPSNFNPSGLLTASVEVLDASGAVAARFDFEKSLPDSLSFDGRDAAGKTLSEGSYKARMKAGYLNGAEPEAVSGAVILDVTPPSAAVTSTLAVFSPDGDGNKDSVDIVQKTDAAPFWKGTLSSPTEPAVLAVQWEGRPPEKLTWNGTDAAGRVLPDGSYTYVLTAEDEAGNRTSSGPVAVKIDTRSFSLAVGTDLEAFSPNGDGDRDVLSVNPVFEAADEIEAYAVTVRAENGLAVRTLSEKKRPPASFPWDGKYEGGSRVLDGMYKVELEVFYINGAAARAETKPFFLDGTPPVVELAPGSLPFSPDNDGKNDVFDLGIEVSDASPIRSWTAKVLDPAGIEVIGAAGEGSPPEKAVWDGLTASGDYVKACEIYTLHYTVRDVLGNETKGTLAVPVDVLVFVDETKPETQVVRVPNVQFAPFTTEYEKWDPEIGKANASAIDLVVEMLRKFPAYRVRLEGHAVSVFWRNKEKSRREHLNTLIPLSFARAETVKKVLVDRGIDPGRIDVKGLGGDAPLVPFSDYQKRWIDRRVEFVLLRD